MIKKLPPDLYRLPRKQLLSMVGLALGVTVAAAIVFYYISSAYVLNQAERNIQNLLLSHKGIHHYVQNTMLPALYKYQAEGEIPASFYAPELFSSSYIVRNQHQFYNEERVAAGFPPLYYKMAAKNPRNPVNKANPLEEKLIKMFNEHRDQKIYRAIIEVNGKKNLYIAIPFLENQQGCMHCHGKREDAPRQLQARYPGQGGFNEKLGEIRAITSIYSPFESEYHRVYIIAGALLAGFFTIIALLLFNTRLAMLVKGRTVNLEEEIEERRQAEENLRKANIELNGKNKELEQVIYVASHDLRSPLVNVQGFSKEAARDFAELLGILKQHNLPDEVREALTPLVEKEIPQSLGFIQNSVVKMDSLLAGLLKISRLGRSALTLVAVDMNRLMAEVVADFEFQTKDQGIDIEVGNLPGCRGDHLQISQVFANLIGNAIKFRAPDRRCLITITGRKEGERSVYTVEDNGIGIEPAYQEKIFEIFHKLDPHSEGQGLGLNIVSKIVERLDGKVWVESEPDAFCRFHVSLPN
jgi:signal transduction histidine kinase